jgi:hypothetical protein
VPSRCRANALSLTQVARWSAIAIVFGCLPSADDTSIYRCRPAPWREIAARKEAAGNSGGMFLAGESGGKAVVSLPRGPRASDWHCRGVPALPIGSCRTGTGTGAPAHLLGSPTRRRDFGGAGAGRFWAPSPKSAPTVFWEAFWERRWRCSNKTTNKLAQHTTTTNQ